MDQHSTCKQHSHYCRLAHVNNTISQLKKEKEEEEKRTRQIALTAERQRLDLAAEKERTRMLSEQLRNMVNREENSGGRSNDMAKVCLNQFALYSNTPIK